MKQEKIEHTRPAGNVIRNSIIAGLISALPLLHSYSAKFPDANDAGARLLARTSDDFKKVFLRQAAVPALEVAQSMDRAHSMLLNFRAIPKDTQAVVIARIDGGRLVDFKTVLSLRPGKGETVQAFCGNEKFTIFRPEHDMGGAFSELRVKSASDAKQIWVPLAAKIFAPSSIHGEKHFIVTPYSKILDSGEMCSAALDYLVSVDSLARNAIRYFVPGKAHLVERLPPSMNVIISIVEQVDPSLVATSENFQYALGRFLYHVAAHRNQSKFLTTSYLGACGPMQIMRNTQKYILNKYEGEPWEVFSLWAEKNSYAPKAWLNPKNRLGDLMYSWIFAYYHHFDILEKLEAELGGQSTLLLYSDPLQTICAAMAGYNGGIKHALKQIRNNMVKGEESFWFENAYENGVRCLLPSLSRKITENHGYIGKTLIAIKGLPNGTYREWAVLKCTSPSSKYNSEITRAAKEKPKKHLKAHNWKRGGKHAYSKHRASGKHQKAQKGHSRHRKR